MVRLIGPINALAVYLEGDDGELFQDQVLDLSRLKLASSGGKGLSYRQRRSYVPKLLRSTQFSTKWLGAASGSTTMATPANLTDARSNFYQVMHVTGTDISAPASWRTFSGNTSTITTAAGGAICRGGYSEVTLAHENAETVWYRVFLCYTTAGIPSDVAAIDKTADPNWTNNLNTVIHIKRCYEGFLETNTAKTFRFKIPPHKIDYQDESTKTGVWFWNVLVGNTVTASSITVTVLASESAWFSGIDVVS